MKPFHTYREGRPPTPGIFATDESKDEAGADIEVGDIIADRVSRSRGVVCGIFGDQIVLLIESPGPASEHEINRFAVAGSVYCQIIGHTTTPLADVARIEAAAVTTLKGGA